MLIRLDAMREPGGDELQHQSVPKRRRQAQGQAGDVETPLSGRSARRQAREKQGLERLDQVRFAVLETTGEISIIPESR